MRQDSTRHAIPTVLLTGNSEQLFMRAKNLGVGGGVDLSMVEWRLVTLSTSA